MDGTSFHYRINLANHKMCIRDRNRATNAHINEIGPSKKNGKNIGRHTTTKGKSVWGGKAWDNHVHSGYGNMHH